MLKDNFLFIHLKLSILVSLTLISVTAVLCVPQEFYFKFADVAAYFDFQGQLAYALWR